jgi:TATA-box binding protein (TBP) (component of TFIID and TFIIIB)
MTELSKKFSPIRVSTMVITADWGTPINLSAVFEACRKNIISIGWPEEGILKCEYSNSIIGNAEKDIFTNRKITTKSFYNQSTIVIRRYIATTSYFKEANIKLFANGGVQMTGVPSEEFARNSLEWLLNFFQSLPVSPFIYPEKAEIKKFGVQLINTDFNVGFDIHQEALHKILQEKYGLFSMLEKTIYQGVNTKYYYNTESKREGICTCTKICKGKGSGNGSGECKKITMSIFRTGEIIITGAKHMSQIHKAHQFLCGVLERYPGVLIQRTI